LLTQPKAKVLASPARDPALTLQDELVVCQVKAKFLVILHTTFERPISSQKEHINHSTRTTGAIA